MKRFLLPILFFLFVLAAQAQPSSNTATYLKRGLDAAKGASCTAGKVWIATDTGILYICPVTAWVSFGTGGGSGLTIGTTTVTSGTGTRLLYETSGNKVGEISGATSDGTTLTAISPVIANIAPGADFTVSQNSVAPFKSVNSGAIVDTLRLDSGIVLVGTTASKTSATSGDEVLANNHFLRGTTSAGTNTRGLIGFNSSNVVSIDTTGTGTVFGGTITSSSGASTLGSSSASWGGLFLGKGITAGGTTGAQTINSPTGTVNFAAAATSLVVTNSLVATTSIIQCTVGTNDTTMKSVQCVAGSGSFTIFSNAAATAETRVNFSITN